MFVGVIIFLTAILFIGFITSIADYGTSMIIAAIVFAAVLYVFFAEGTKFKNKSSLKEIESDSEDALEEADEDKNEIYIFENSINTEEETGDNKNESAKEYIFPTNNLLN